ncbi:hypothetical protein ZHAS_00000891 [Anopheles sinensis]|uniref:Leucine-rich immune protein (Short) n=1 Tax=Anopheles sinensis TaxID=74873 RepID=A0A084VAR8_ANOSI|nr:hypothetical protein ZHAS_00000891 [Anopheles sinensis]
MLSHNNLSTTAWLQPFTQLETLDLSHNKIEDITSNDFKQLQRLRELKLNNNRLFRFDMSKNQMKSLKLLDLSHNELVYVEYNQKQFDLLEQLYLDHNSIVLLKPMSSRKLKHITLSYNDWDCAKMQEILGSFPSTVNVDYHAETYCNNEKLQQGLCCKNREKPYHDRLIMKIAEVTSYEKVARANGRCNVTSLIPSVQQTSDQVTKSQDLPTSQLESELQELRAEVQRAQQDVQQKGTQVTNNINKIDELTRIYRVVKKGLTQPSFTLGNVFGLLKQRDEFKVNETIARYGESEGKNATLQSTLQTVGEYENMLKTKNERRAEIMKKIPETKKQIKQLERDLNANVKGIRNGK